MDVDHVLSRLLWAMLATLSVDSRPPIERLSMVPGHPMKPDVFWEFVLDLQGLLNGLL